MIDHFQAQVEPHLPAAYRTAALILLDRELARDAVQEALLRAYRSRDRLRPGAPVWPWLHRLVVNEALRLAGRRRRQPLLLGEWPDLPAGAPGPETALLTRETRDGIWQALTGLSEAHRTVLVLRYYQELTEQEMAEVLGISPGTVKSRLHHARRLLEERLTREQAAPGLQGRIDHV